jgi:hypothetical protein
MPRLTACRASSLCVHWLIGTSNRSGASHAIAIIWQICSGVKVAGPPQRGASLRRCRTSADGSAVSHRRRQWPAVLRQIPSCCAISPTPNPSDDSNTIRARSANCCGVECVRISPRSVRSCSADRTIGSALCAGTAGPLRNGRLVAPSFDSQSAGLVGAHRFTQGVANRTRSTRSESPIPARRTSSRGPRRANDGASRANTDIVVAWHA